MLHVNIIMLLADINKSHVKINPLHVDINVIYLACRVNHTIPTPYNSDPNKDNLVNAISLDSVLIHISLF